MLKKMDGFSRNILIVFAGSSIGNLFALLCQLFIAHRLIPSDFAAFNSLLSIYVIITAPAVTLQAVIAKFGAEFNAKKETAKIKFFLSDLLKKMFFLAVLSFVLLWLNSSFLARLLKISSPVVLVIFSFLIGLTWILPVFSGGTQGLELFGWVTSSSIISGVSRLSLAVIFIAAGFGISGALGAFVFANLAAIFINYFPLRNFVSFFPQQKKIDYGQILPYLLPVGAGFFCFNALVNIDMVLVRRFFTPVDSGFYSLAQMLGKIFLFLPGAISIVMFPKASGLKAVDMDTAPTLKKSLLYVFILSFSAVVFYNLFPVLVLKILTGKAYPESVMLGRLFSVSMSFFAAIFIFISYFLSVKDLRFIKYLIAFTILQVFLIYVFHQSLVQVQLVLCASSILLSLVCFRLAFIKKL